MCKKKRGRYGEKNGGVKIEIKRCEVGRKSTGITGQAVVQGFLSNVWLKSVMKERKRGCSLSRSPFRVHESVCETESKSVFS